MLPFVLATIPLVVSILLVNTFLYPGATDVLFQVGPFAATGTGLVAALQATLRVVAFAPVRGGVLADDATPTTCSTTSSGAVSDGAGEFVIGAAMRTVPRMIERAGEIVDAQRARGLDTQGGVIRRASAACCRWPGR